MYFNARVLLRGGGDYRVIIARILFISQEGGRHKRGV